MEESWDYLMVIAGRTVIPKRRQCRRSEVASVIILPAVLSFFGIQRFLYPHLISAPMAIALSFAIAAGKAWLNQARSRTWLWLEMGSDTGLILLFGSVIAHRPGMAVAALAVLGATQLIEYRQSCRSKLIGK